MAIVAVNSEKLVDVCTELLGSGVKRILLEKPGGLSFSTLERLNKLQDIKKANVFVGYNRRYYSSVLEAEKVIQQDGGLLSCSFDFTEWSDQVSNLGKTKEVYNTWLIGNSSHVIDLGFHFTGLPEEISSFHSGTLPWHPASSTFSGAGVSQRGILFNYTANWDSAGRWGVELHTKKRKLILRPLEELKCILRGSVEEQRLEVDNSALDEAFKPGLYRQVKCFIDGENTKLKTLLEQIEFLKICNAIAGYTE